MKNSQGKTNNPRWMVRGGAGRVPVSQKPSTASKDNGKKPATKESADKKK